MGELLDFLSLVVALPNCNEHGVYFCTFWRSADDARCTRHCKVYCHAGTGEIGGLTSCEEAPFLLNVVFVISVFKMWKFTCHNSRFMFLNMLFSGSQPPLVKVFAHPVRFPRTFVIQKIGLSSLVYFVYAALILFM